MRITESCLCFTSSPHSRGVETGSRGCCDESKKNPSQSLSEKTLGRNQPPGRCQWRGVWGPGVRSQWHLPLARSWAQQPLGGPLRSGMAWAGDARTAGGRIPYPGRLISVPVGLRWPLPKQASLSWLQQH